MSRVGKMPISLPAGVEVTIAADKITVKGANDDQVDGAARAFNGLLSPSGGIL